LTITPRSPRRGQPGRTEAQRPRPSCWRLGVEGGASALCLTHPTRLSIEPLRHVHLPAFRTIAGLLGARRLVYLPDDDPIILDTAKSEGASLDECIAELQRRWGPPQASVEELDPELVRRSDFCVPSAWYVETLPSDPAR
jgi:hypothetical protein